MEVYQAALEMVQDLVKLFSSSELPTKQQQSLLGVNAQSMCIRPCKATVQDLVGQQLKGATVLSPYRDPLSLSSKIAFIRNAVAKKSSLDVLERQ